ncbi:MAG: proprotein convertase P-domain-containing protein [Anaerolineae bacterium]|nr:proprotein convertase P-domain-containing protein [Anaerolineae bacterium]
MSVGFIAAHDHRDDLQVELASPSGTRVRLVEDDGVSGTDARHYNVLLDDAGGGSYNRAGDDDPTAASGTFARLARPAAPLRALAGESAQGTWTLTVCNTNSAADEGDYRQSRLILTPQAGQSLPQTGAWAYTLSAGDERVDAIERTVSLYGVDLAGNRAEALTARYILDNVAPVITVTNIANMAVYSPSLTVLTGAVTDGGAVASMAVLVESDEATYRDVAVLDGTTWHYTLRPMSPGHYTLWVGAYDTAGNMTSIGPFEVEVHISIFQLLYLPLVSCDYIPNSNSRR